MSGEVWSAKFGPLWDKWDKPVRDGAAGPGHEVIVPDGAMMVQWRDALRPVTDSYLAALSKTFPGAPQAYGKLAAQLRH
jgi:hypothetical protein